MSVQAVPLIADESERHALREVVTAFDRSASIGVCR